MSIIRELQQGDKYTLGSRFDPSPRVCEGGRKARTIVTRTPVRFENIGANGALTTFLVRIMGQR
jgi:hypothetical protein